MSAHRQETVSGTCAQRKASGCPGASQDPWGKDKMGQGQVPAQQVSAGLVHTRVGLLGLWAWEKGYHQSQLTAQAQSGQAADGVAGELSGE